MVAHGLQDDARIHQALDCSAFRWRHLTGVAVVERLATVRDRRDMRDGSPIDRSHDAGKFAERTFLLSFSRRDFAFDYDLAICGDVQVDGFAAHQFDRLAFQAAGELHFVLALGQVGDRCEMNRGLCSNDPCNWRLLAAIRPGLRIEGALPAGREVDDYAVAVTHHSAIHAHILRTAVTIAGDDDGPDIWCFVLPGRPGDDRQIGEGCCFSEKLSLLTWSCVYGSRSYRPTQCRDHGIVDGVDFTLKGKRDASR